MHPDIVSAACHLYHTTPELLTPLSGGHYNAVYQFPCENGHAILRIGVEDCPADSTLGMLEWVQFLSREGAPVAAPIPSIHGTLLESLAYGNTRYTLTAFEKTGGTLAEDLPPAKWTDELFFNLGKAVGKLHRVSARYHPSTQDHVLPPWYASNEIHEAALRLAGNPAGQKLTTLLEGLKELPTGADEYGLIHADLHFANFLLRPDGGITIIDFDDAAYGWFAMDVAMGLFDVLVLYDPADEAEKQRFAQHFLAAYLSGYRTEKDLSPFWLGQLTRMLKLKELCIYASLLGHADVEKPGTWVGRFMSQRLDRVADDMPYVDIDFSRVASG